MTLIFRARNKGRAGEAIIFISIREIYFHIRQCELTIIEQIINNYSFM
jgi:hypothetical protein